MLRRLGKALLLGVLVVSTATAPVSAIDTAPSVPPKVDGPLLISGYSFSGHSIRYVQIYNTSSEVVSLQGWKLTANWTSDVWQSQELSGLMAPKTKLTIADGLVIPGATFTFSGVAASEPRFTSLQLVPPSTSNWLEHVVSIGINDTTGASRTPRVATIPETFYFARNISTSTGSYLSTFSAFIPPESFVLESDELYEPPTASPLKIVEIYPHAISCAPNETSILCRDYVKLYNSSDEPVDTTLFRLRTGSFGQSASASNTAYMAGVVPAGSYVVFPLNLVDSGNWVWVEDMYGTNRYDDTMIAYPSASSREGWAWAYNSTSDGWQWTQFPTPSDEPNRFVMGGTVNSCEGLRLSEIAANTSAQFIEVYNPSSAAMDISGCQLQTNRSSTKSYVFSAGSRLGAGEYLAVDVADTPLALTKTTTGTVYILSSDGSTEVDARYYENLNENTSFALIGDTWLQTFTRTPNAANQYAKYLPCQAGYERNEATGRCNKIAVAATKKPCLPTQYRSPETGRCRKLSLATSSLTPCGPGKYRNPATNRCKSLAATASALKPCRANQERNPATNRCRNIVSNVNADFPVEAVANTGMGTVGWWAFGGVGIAAAGYAGWEWRRELMGTIKKASLFIAPGK